MGKLDELNLISKVGEGSCALAGAFTAAFGLSLAFDYNSDVSVLKFISRAATDKALQKYVAMA